MCCYYILVAYFTPNDLYPPSPTLFCLSSLPYQFVLYGSVSFLLYSLVCYTV